MCGRYASFRSAQDLADAFHVDALLGVDDAVRALPPSWNVAPTRDVRIVVERPGHEDGSVRGGDAGRPGSGSAPGVTRSLRLARWGLVPSWAKDPSVGTRMINTRAETLLEKRTFAKPLAARRCIVPADGYYEWKVLGTPSGAKRPRKQPYFFHPADDDVAALAGLYEFWRDPARGDDDPERWLVTTTIITRPATPDAAAVHDRMPLALPRDAWDTWLDPAVGAEGAAELLRVTPEPMAQWPVSGAVSSVRNDSPALVAPAIGS